MITAGRHWASKRSTAAVDYSLPAKRVTRLLDRLVRESGKPQRLRSDNGPEFISDELQEWGTTNEVDLHWIEPRRRTVWQTHAKRLYRAV